MKRRLEMPSAQRRPLLHYRTEATAVLEYTGPRDVKWTTFGRCIGMIEPATASLDGGHMLAVGHSTVEHTQISYTEGSGVPFAGVFLMRGTCLACGHVQLRLVPTVCVWLSVQRL